MNATPLRVVLTLAVLTLAAGASCGSEGAADGAGSSSSSGHIGPSNGDDGGAGDGSASASCSAPVDMFIMFNRSTSMGDDGALGATTSKWTRAITALSGYFNAAASKDQGAAIQFFPLPDHSQAQCATGDGYAVPAAPAGPPAFTTLPTSTFDALLDDQSPQPEPSGTPTEAAIRGLARFTSKNRRPGHVTIGILITDGEPIDCNEDRSFLSGLLAEHYKTTQIRTYVIGMQGADFPGLEEIAADGGAPEHPDTIGAVKDACGGGKDSCHHWNVGDGDPAVFGAALAAIQDSADGCKPGGGVINPVN